MRTSRGVQFAQLIVLLTVILFGSLASPAQTGTQSASEYDALVQALEATTPLPASNAPTFGNFYTLQHGEAWPPLPADTLNLPFWDLGGGVFILDDTNVDYSALQAESASAGRFRFDESLESDYSTTSYTSNDLYLQITGVTNGTASLVIHPPWNVTNGMYDLLYRTNPTPPDSWHWVLRIDPGQTNLAVPNATNRQGFYQLGPPNDLTANDSLGTNFWLAIPSMYTGADTAISLYISSPVGASGAVTIQNETNGVTLIATNCGESRVNGTYVLTNETVDPALYEPGQLPYFEDVVITNAYTNGSLLFFFYPGDGWFLVDSSTYEILYAQVNYVPDYVVNLNDVDWADWHEDLMPPVPTTLCQESTFLQNFSLAAGGLTSVSLPPATMLITNNDVIATNYAVHITSSAPVSVYAADYFPAASAAFTAYPTSFLGTNYCLLARASSYDEDDGRSEFAILATVDGTTVTNTPSPTANLYGHSGTNAFTVALQKGQTYQIRSMNGTGDVTGTLINSDNPIAVFAGASLANVPDALTGAANPLVQEQIPVEDWGTNALALSFAGRANGASYRILAASNNTVISISGQVVTVNTNSEIPPGPWMVTTSNETVLVTNQAGQFYDIIVDGPAEFRASHPIQVAQYSNGVYFDSPPNQDGDPCEILLPSTGHYLMTNIVVCLPNEKVTGDFDKNYLNIIVPQSAITNTWVDTNLLSPSSFEVITNTGYYGAQVLTNSGKHFVTSSEPVGVEAYGFGITDAYGYSGGIVK